MSSDVNFKSLLSDSSNFAVSSEASGVAHKEFDGDIE